MNLYLVSLFLVLLPLLMEGSELWPNHDISTLKLLQVMHRHGDRTPASFGANDPFKDRKYWTEDPGKLTNYGRYRMYKKGQFIRNEYMDYLGDKYAKGEVYDRSSEELRVIESTQAVLAGAYPPVHDSQKWNLGNDAILGKYWQPIPVYTFMPIFNDFVCTQESHCPALEEERERIFNDAKVNEAMKPINDFCDEFMERVGPVATATGHNMTGSLRLMLCLAGLGKDMRTETRQGYIWYGDKEEQLATVTQAEEWMAVWKDYYWGSPLARRLSTGGLIGELNKNINTVLNNTNNKKVYIYGTHDSNIEGFRHSLHIEDDSWAEFGAMIFFELHQKLGSAPEQLNNWFLRVYYHNSTLVEPKFYPYSLPWTDCSHPTDCPLDEYLKKTAPLLYDNHDKICGNTGH